MLNEEEKKIVEYLRMSPKDSLKRDAADLIERLSNDCQSFKEIAKELDDFNEDLIQQFEIYEKKKTSIWQAIKEKFK